MPTTCKCAYKNCESTKKKNPNLTFHRFPLDESEQVEWAFKTGNDFSHLKPAQIREKRICSLHFVRDDYCPLLGNEISKNLKPHVLPIGIDLTNVASENTSANVQNKTLIEATNNSSTVNKSTNGKHVFSTLEKNYSKPIFVKLNKVTSSEIKKIMNGNQISSNIFKTFVKPINVQPSKNEQIFLIKKKCLDNSMTAIRINKSTNYNQISCKINKTHSKLTNVASSGIKLNDSVQKETLMEVTNNINLPNATTIKKSINDNQDSSIICQTSTQPYNVLLKSVSSPNKPANSVQNETLMEIENNDVPNVTTIEKSTNGNGVSSTINKINKSINDKLTNVTTIYDTYTNPVNKKFKNVTSKNKPANSVQKETLMEVTNNINLPNATIVKRSVNDNQVSSINCQTSTQPYNVLLKRVSSPNKPADSVQNETLMEIENNDVPNVTTIEKSTNGNEVSSTINKTDTKSINAKIKNVNSIRNKATDSVQSETLMEIANNDTPNVTTIEKSTSSNAVSSTINKINKSINVKLPNVTTIYRTYTKPVNKKLKNVTSKNKSANSVQNETLMEVTNNINLPGATMVEKSINSNEVSSKISETCDIDLPNITCDDYYIQNESLINVQDPFGLSTEITVETSSIREFNRKKQRPRTYTNENLMEKIQKYRGQIKKLQSEVSYLKKRLRTRKIVMSKDELINLNASFFNKEQAQFFKMQLKSKGHTWTEEEKQFSKELYVKSRAAYLYLRNDQHFVLPCVKLVQKWKTDLLK